VQIIFWIKDCLASDVKVFTLKSNQLKPGGIDLLKACGFPMLVDTEL